MDIYTLGIVDIYNVDDYTNAIYIENCSQVSVYNNQLEVGAIIVEHSNNSTILGNILKEGWVTVGYCKNILIESNYCANTSWPTFGIYINWCEHITIRNNNCTNNELGGIGCEDSVDVKIIGNNCWKNKMYAGIDLINVIKAEIKENKLSDNMQDNIDIFGCKSVTVFNNTLINSHKFNSWYGNILGLGIWVDEWDEHSEDIIIEQNYIERNLVGVSVYRSEYITVRNNYINSSYVAGIKVFKAKATTITYNTLSYNPYGVYVCGSKPTNVIDRFPSLFMSTSHSIRQQQKGFDDNNTNYHEVIDAEKNSINFIHHNNFIDNNLNDTFNSQAYDDSTNTRWYDSRTHEGNYWSDWNGTGPYALDGSAHSFDLYPLSHSVTYHPFSFFDYWFVDPLLFLFLPFLLLSSFSYYFGTIKPKRNKKTKKTTK